MTLRINPTIPRVWRSPTSLQYGIDAPLAVLERVGVGEERMLELLAIGTPRTGLDAMGSEHGLTSLQIREFIEAIGPALDDGGGDVAAGAPRRAPAHITLTGSSPTANQIDTLLSSEGHSVVRTESLGTLDDTPGAFGIAVAHFVIEPELHGAWLRHDVPHLPVVWGDGEVRIGPVIEPGQGPCLYCLDRVRADADPAWPAIASQLWGRVSPLERPLLAAEVAVTAARLVLERLSGARGNAQSTAIDATGRITRQTHVRHPECGCHGWGELVALPKAAATNRTTTTAAGAAAKATPGRVRRETAMATVHRAGTNATTSREGADARA